MELETYLWVTLISLLIVAGIFHIISMIRNFKYLSKPKTISENFFTLWMEIHKKEFENIQNKLKNMEDDFDDLQVNIYHSTDRVNQMYGMLEEVLDDKDNIRMPEVRPKRKYVRRIKALEHKEEGK